MNSSDYTSALELKTDLVTFVQDITRIPSLSSREGAVIERIRQEMERLGYDEVTVDPMGNLLGRIGNGPRVIAIDGHVDVVFGFTTPADVPGFGVLAGDGLGGLCRFRFCRRRISRARIRRCGFRGALLLSLALFFGAFLCLLALRRSAALTLCAQAIVFYALTGLGQRFCRCREFRALRIELARFGKQRFSRAEAAAIDFFTRLQHYFARDHGQTGLRGGIAGVIAQRKLIVIAGVIVAR